MTRWLLLLALACCTKKDGVVEARLLGGDADGMDFELVGPPGVEFENGGKQQLVGAGRVRVPAAGFGPTQTQKCFPAHARSLPDGSKACATLPRTMKELGAFPARGAFAVLSSRPAGAALELTVVAPGAGSLELGGQRVALDGFGVGTARLDLRSAFIGAGRPDPSMWSRVTVPLAVDGVARAFELPFDGASVVQSWLGAPSPEAADGLLWVAQRPNAPAKSVRVSGSRTLPLRVATETHTSRPGGLCFGRPSELVDRELVVRDVQRNAEVAKQRFAAKPLRCTGVFDRNNLPVRYFGFAEDEVLLEWLRAQSAP